MKALRDCPAARWLPSRHRFALARLIAFLRLRAEASRPRPADVDHEILVIDRDQTAIEHYAVSAWIFLTIVCYIAAMLPLPMGVAFVAALPLSGVAVQIPTYTFAGRKVNSVLTMVLMIVASSYFGMAASPVRYVAWFFFAVIAFNAAAWLIMMLMRDRVLELEQRCGI
ncbi:MAG TPA: hypothetical protein VII12_06580 [Thermoanaerobaculia bacterium]